MGCAVLAAARLDAVTALVVPADRTAELRRIAVLLFDVMDNFTGWAATAFLGEQAAWAASVPAAHAAT